MRAGAWELVVTWHGDPVRADLLQGEVRVSAAGPTASDLPLPLDTRQTLLRGNANGLELLPVAGAAWAIDGQPAAAAGAAHLASDQGPARLALGNLEVAVQGTPAPPVFPRFVAADAAVLRVTVHLVAAALVGLTLTTEPTEPPAGSALAPTRRVVPTAEVTPRAPVPAFPRAPGNEPLDDVPGRRVPSRRRAVTVRVQAPAPAEAAGVDLPALDAASPWPPELDVEPGVDPLADLASASLRIANAGRGSAAAGRHDGGAGGMGSCAGPYFDLLVRRYGRDTAIVACSPGVQFERRPGAHEAVLQERASTALAPEIWSWGGGHGQTMRTESVSSTGDAAPSEKSRTSISR